MSEEDVLFATTQLIDSSTIIKENLDNETIENIEKYLKECREIGGQANIELIKEFIKNNSIEYRKSTSYMNDTLELIEKYQNYYIKAYPIAKSSVFEKFEEDKLNFFRDSFTTIGGNSSSGKTSLVTQLVRDLLIANDNAICLFYSLDDGDYMGMRKVIQHVLNYYEPQLKLPSYNEAIHPNYITNLENNKNNIESVLKRIVMLDNFKDIEADIEIVKSKMMNISENPLLIIALDYLHILPNDEGKDARTFFNETMKYLKEIQQQEAKNGGCIFFMLSQLNRNSSTMGNAGINSFRESSEIENLSDIAITIDYIKTENDNGETLTDRNIRIVKNKIGIKKSYTVKVDSGIITKIENYKSKSGKNGAQKHSNAGKVYSSRNNS